MRPNLAWRMAGRTASVRRIWFSTMISNCWRQRSGSTVVTSTGGGPPELLTRMTACRSAAARRRARASLPCRREAPRRRGRAARSRRHAPRASRHCGRAGRRGSLRGQALRQWRNPGPGLRRRPGPMFRRVRDPWCRVQPISSCDARPPQCPRRDGGGETGLQQIAAGGRLPVQHLAHAIGAGHLLQLEMRVDLVAAPRRRPTRWRARCRRGVSIGRHGLDALRIRRRARLAQQVDGDGREARRLAQEVRLRVLAARAREALGQRLLRQVGAEIDHQRMAGLFAQALGERIDGAALDALLRDHQLAAHALSGIGERHVLDRRAGELVAEDGRPVDEEAAVGGLEGIDA